MSTKVSRPLGSGIIGENPFNRSSNMLDLWGVRVVSKSKRRPGRQVQNRVYQVPVTGHVQTDGQVSARKSECRETYSFHSDKSSNIMLHSRDRTNSLSPRVKHPHIYDETITSLSLTIEREREEEK